MERDRGGKSTYSSTDPKSTKSTKDSIEAREKREYKDSKKNKKEQDLRDLKYSKDAKETKSDHRRDRESRNERDRGSERDEKRERERAEYSRRDGRSERDRRYEHDRRTELDKKGERESRRDRDSKSECHTKHDRNNLRNAFESKRELHTRGHSECKSEQKGEREFKTEHLGHTKSSKDGKEKHSEHASKDKRELKDVQEVKLNKEERRLAVEKKTKTAMEDIKELIMRALECELDGHVLEACMLYEESLAKLKSCSTQDKNEEILESYRKYLNTYEIHVQRLRDQIEQTMFGCKIIEHITIPEGVRGRSFEKLFGCYLNEKVSLVHIYEPYLTQNTQLEHLINFIEVLIKNCPNLMFLRIITRASSNTSALQAEVLHDLREELEGGNITFNYQFDEQLKKPRIILNTGVVIRCRRGLHIHKPMPKYYKLGLYDYDFRRCESCEFDVYQGKPFSESISKADRTDLMESLLHA
ncbi:histone-lysine N-methyltransferase, H3 lysine-79 specific-like [Eurosta solidaginis]|uniref:histone-lysine N-methyltransferase, H3 lysine-79 specific-like n=1 Tax=Eurosta solidaginis TaxID=178769 RepID=UPI003530E84C